MSDVVVAGTSLPALQTALDLAEVGLRVTVASSPDAEVHPDERVRDPDGVVAAFAERIESPVEPGHDPLPGATLRRDQPQPPLLRNAAGRWLPQAEPNVQGIPAVPLAEETLALLGSSGAARAYLDRVMPLLTVGKTRMFGALVKKRLGARALATLVQPQVFARYGVPAEKVEVAVAAPGLNEALSRSGALTSAALAYSERNVARETAVTPAAGWDGLSTALRQRLEWYGVAFIDSSVSDAQWRGDRWELRGDDGTALQSRALVADFGRSVRSATDTMPRSTEFAPAALRAYAQIDIDVPAWLGEKRSAVTISGDTSLMIEAVAGQSDRARITVASARRDVQPDEHVASVARELRERAVSRAAAACEEAGMPRSEGAEWRVAVVAAPAVSLDEQHHMLSKIDRAWSEQPSLLPVGQSLYGDDLAEALRAAHDAAVRLRRHLLGLDETE